MKTTKRILAAMVLVIVAVVSFPTIAFADTTGTEIQIIDQPDKLILQLGPQWAGVEFELKTDAGIFPVPVVVDSTGVLKMDLGGSKNYTLSCITSPVTVPGPEQLETQAPPSPDPAGSAADEKAESEQENGGIPVGILVMFLIGLAAAVGGLIAMRYFKHRRDSYTYDDDDDYE